MSREKILSVADLVHQRAALEEVGAEIRILPLVPGKSTTGTLERMRAEG